MAAERDDAETRASRYEKDVHELTTQVSFLEEEVGMLRRRLTESPRHLRVLEERLAEAQSRVAALSERNEKLAGTLREARDQVVALKEEVDRLAQPPSGYGIFLSSYDDGTVDVFTGGRKLRVAVSPNVNFPIVVVTTVYPGADPETIEANVTKPIEDAIASLPNIDANGLTSVSASGLSTVSTSTWRSTGSGMPSA